MAETLQCAVGDIENLAVVSENEGEPPLHADATLNDVAPQTLLEQSSSAHEQAKFVKRLRTMSASFD